jgi:hypothetical protein
VFVIGSDLIVTAKPGSLDNGSPGPLDNGSPGPLTSGHLSMEMPKLTAGVNITHIPYKGAHRPSRVSPAGGCPGQGARAGAPVARLRAA